MMITKEDKEKLIKVLKSIDPKTLDHEHANPSVVKWYRFGAVMGLGMACDIIKGWPEDETAAAS